MALHVYQCSILLPIDMIWNDIAMNTYTYEKESNTNSSCMFTNVFMVKHQNASQKTWSSTILDILKTVKRSALLLTSHAWLFLTPTKRLETIHSSMQLLSFGTNCPVTSEAVSSSSVFKRSLKTFLFPHWEPLLFCFQLMLFCFSCEALC